MITQLSGGMLRRAALAQLLSQRKRLIVLDEPFTGLDLDTAKGIIQELRAVMKEECTSFILISHQVNPEPHLHPHSTIALTRCNTLPDPSWVESLSLRLVHRIRLIWPHFSIP